MENKISIKQYGRTYIQHETSPLSHTKVQEAELIVEPLNNALASSSK